MFQARKYYSVVVFCFFFFNKFNYFWLRWVFVAEQGLLFVVVRVLLFEVASLVASMGSRRTGFNSCGT